jgi:hypothetical protein
MNRPVFAAQLALLIVGALCLAFPSVGAQQTTTGASTYPIGIGVGAGILIPTGDIGNLQSTGWNLQAFADWESRTSPLALRAEATFGSLIGKTFPGPTVTLRATDLHVFTITGDGVWMFRPSPGSQSHTTPYIMAGIGLYHTSGSSELSSGGSMDLGTTNFGINFGGGIIYRLAGFATYAELRYHNVFNGAVGVNGNTSAHYIPLVVGIRFGGR